MTYNELPVTKRTGFIGEDPAAYKTIFDKKVDDYVKRLERLEGLCSQPGAKPDEILAEVTLLNDGILAECARYEAHLPSRDAVNQAREQFRQRTHAILGKSYFINQSRTWPRGYQGDYSMLEGVYRNIPLASGIGYYLDRYSLSTTLAEAVRQRRKTLRDMLQLELAGRTAPRVLDVACGSCREVFELAPAIVRSKALVTCVDFDSEALAYSANRMALSGVEDGQVEFRQYNALRMISHERNLKEFGMQDIIYSVGFFDYLEDDVLVRLLGSLYRLVSPGGVLIMSFKDIRRYNTAYYQWMVHWDGFFPRTEEDHRIVVHKAGIPVANPDITRDDSGVIVFFMARK
jgi:SAM-dependent methyltransferase